MQVVPSSARPADLAPADRALYAIRDVTGTVESIPLITASILSKKLAAGLDALILYVKTGSGVFNVYAGALARAGAKPSCRCQWRQPEDRCVITDMSEPLAIAAGNGLEVHNAVNFLTGYHQDPCLKEITLSLCAAVAEMTGVAATIEAGCILEEVALDISRATKRFAVMVHALGGPGDFIDRLDSYWRPGRLSASSLPTVQARSRISIHATSA